MEKFAFGMSPLTSSRDRLPVISIEKEDGAVFPVLTVYKNPEAEGVVYGIESSSNLLQWAPDGGVVEETSGLLRTRFGAGLEEGDRPFFRVRLTFENLSGTD